jgi:hypothetical protein
VDVGKPVVEFEDAGGVGSASGVEVYGIELVAKEAFAEEIEAV